MKNKVVIAGVGMTPFLSPKARKSYIEFGKAALEAALHDAGIAYDKIQQAYTLVGCMGTLRQGKQLFMKQG